MENVYIQSERGDVSHSKFNICCETQQALARVKVLGTGGTIAAKGSSATQTAGYQVDLSIEDLVSQIPDLSSICALEYEQILNVDSKEIMPHHLLLLHKEILRAIHDDSYDGVVITHGTDTMEETAFFMQLTVDTPKPIVFAGSMRPSTAISADGPMNFYQAIVIASSPESRNRGVLVALNDTIGSGFYITKSNANSLDTFKSIGQGYLGTFVNDHVHYFYPPVKPSGVRFFDISKLENARLPRVDIFYGAQGFDPSVVNFVVEHFESQGVVFATMGAGSLSTGTNDALEKLYKKRHLPIIYSKRSMDGTVPHSSLPEINGAIASGYLNPQKSKILLQLCLLKEMDLELIKLIFRGVYGG